MQKLTALELRRHELQAQAHRERKELAKHFEPWEKPLSWADKGVDIFNFFKGNPVLLTGAFAALERSSTRLKWHDACSKQRTSSRAGGSAGAIGP